jgi:Transposase DDE domain
VSAVAQLIGELSEVCAGLPDQRKGPPRDGDYTMADIGLAAFSIFFMGSPSFLGHQRALAEGHGRSNCETLFGVSAIPSDNYIRLMLDGATPAAFDRLFLKAMEAAGPLTRFQCLDGRVLIALDGTEHFCSRKIKCEQCSTRRRSDGGTEYFHAFLGTSMVAPGHKQVLPLPPEFIAPQDGTEKQDCERNAAKRWLASHGAAVARLRPVYLGDDLFACQPIVAAIHNVGGNFILTCKPSSHKTVAEYLQGAERQEHRQTVGKRGKRTTTVDRWLNAVPLRATADAILVNWLSIETFNAKGKRTYYNSFVSDLAITPDTVAELAACGRARWKIENETFNVLKTNGYNLEHNFGHGKKTLASVLVTLNLLAFAFHTAAYLGVIAWRAAVIARGPAYRFFEHLRTITLNPAVG